MLWEWVGMGLGFLLARQLIATAREARAVVVVMVALSVALSGYGLYQYAYEMPETRARYAADPDRTMRDAGLWYPPDSPGRESFKARLNSPEPIATFALTNSLAAVLSVVCNARGMAVARGLSQFSRAPLALTRSVGRPWSAKMGLSPFAMAMPNRKWLAALAGCALPVGACLLLTKSRSGYIAAGVGLLLVWLTCRERTNRSRWKWPAAVVVVMAVSVAAVAAVKGVDRELLARATKSFGYRLQYWQSSWQMIARHPIVGCGPGNFQNEYTRCKLPEAAEEVAEPHNFLLEIWATAGTPAIVAMGLVLGCFAWATLRDLGRGTGGEERAVPGIAHRKDSNPQSPIPNPSANPSVDAGRHILIGGMTGFLLSVPVGRLERCAAQRGGGVGGFAGGRADRDAPARLGPRRAIAALAAGGGSCHLVG